MALDPAASDCYGAARRPWQPAKHGLRAPPVLVGTGSALAEARQGPRLAATSSRSVDERQAPLAAGSHAAALGCAKTSPRGPQPRRRGALPDPPPSPGAAEGSKMENPTPRGPRAEGRPGNSLHGLPARAESLIFASRPNHPTGGVEQNRGGLMKQTCPAE